MKSWFNLFVLYVVAYYVSLNDLNHVSSTVSNITNLKIISQIFVENLKDVMIWILDNNCSFVMNTSKTYLKIFLLEAS